MPSSIIPLFSKIVPVTGGGRGIGAVVALRLARSSVRSIPRQTRPEAEAADLAGYLAGPEAAPEAVYVTGASLRIDGGLTA